MGDRQPHPQPCVSSEGGSHGHVMSFSTALETNGDLANG